MYTPFTRPPGPPSAPDGRLCVDPLADVRVKPARTWTKPAAMAWALLLATLLGSLPARASTPGDAAAVPHLDTRGQAAYREFLAAPLHRAFAIAPGGAWGWSADAVSPDAAERQALDACARHAPLPCVPYATDRRVVFDARAWPTLWRPYANAEAARHARVGVARGERFPDLRLTAPDGRSWRVSTQRGKVVLLHFWGSWCPTCAHELPQFARLQQAFKGRDDMVFVYTQARESAADARRWLRDHKLALTLHDSGVKDRRDHSFRLADGRTIADREVAAVFPTTYVLDRHGIVVFALRGAARDWTEFEPFLRDLLDWR
jgi:peroxiredoxin